MRHSEAGPALSARGPGRPDEDESIRPRAPGTSELPLSLAQERMWFLAQLDPGDASFNLFLVHRLRGALAPEALGRALAGVVARHESLRTRFAAEAGRPRQVVDPHWRPTLERLDLTGLPHQERERRSLDLVAERTNAPFDLAQAPPLRASLLRLGERDHVLCLVLHHIVADGWSVGLFCQELAARYEACLQGRPSPPEPLSLQYADYALWQRERLEGPALQESLRYWSARLAGAPVLRLPTDRPRPAIRTSNGASVTRRLPGPLVDSVERLAREARCTLFMALLAAFQVLLCNRSGQEDVCVGSPAAGRDWLELEPLIGLFLNTMVLRGDLSGDPSFRELLARTRATTLEAYAHQDIPFERLTTELTLRRDLSRTPLFEAMLTLQAPDAAAISLAGLEVESYEAGHRHAKLDLALEAWRDGTGELVGTFVYNSDIFDAATVAGMARDLEALLRAAVADPDARLSALPAPAGALLAASERRRVLVELNRTTTAGLGEATLVELLQAQGARRPDAVALSWAGGELTHAELHRRANRLARALRRRGVGAETPVAICAERSPELVVGLLAVLVAGGAYVPLDPRYPAPRLAAMLADSGAPLVLSQERLLPLLRPEGPPVLCLDRDWPVVARERGDELEPVAGHANLAYVIYTSGSTGRPNGVLVERGALLSRVRWMHGHYGLGETDRVLQLASASFDTHAEEVYPCLLAGGTLVLGPPAEELADFLGGEQGRRLTVLDLATPQWHELVGDLRRVPWPPDLRLVVLGADQVRAGALAAWWDVFGERVRLLNTYGPTEATIVASAARLEPGDRSPRPPIGRPVDDTQLHVLDERLEPVPLGAPGELCIGGAGLARGYLGRPDLTARRFVPNPHGTAGARLYRTGDRARHRPDGQLEFLGRVDDQVKVRGHRVEPGELEAALLEHPHVRQAVVVAREDGSGDRRLVAYVVPRPGVEPTTAELRRHLGRTLPEHLLPSAFVSLERLPLTPHGKLDRRALPEPDGRPALEHAYVAPRTDGEELVASVWAEVLGLDRVGALDDFFELGGHSLLATRVVARLRDTLDVEVSLRALFSARTVARLAEEVEDLLVAEIQQLSDEEAERQVAAHDG